MALIIQCSEKISEEHKRILSKVNRYKRSEETKRKMSISQTEKFHSKETKEILSKKHLGLKIHTEERKEFLRKRWIENNPNKGKDMSSGNNPSAKPVLGPDGTIYPTIKECAKQLNRGVDTIRNWCKNNKNGFTFVKK